MSSVFLSEIILVVSIYIYINGYTSMLRLCSCIYAQYGVDATLLLCVCNMVYFVCVCVCAYISEYTCLSIVVM